MQKILISGAGPAGLSLALLLDPAKFDVEIVERSKSFNTVGFSIILWKAGFDVLTEIAAESDLEKISDINSMSLFGGHDFKKLYSSDTTGLGHSVDREQLMKILSTRYLDKFGTKNIRFETSVKDITDNGGIADVEFNDGSTQSYDLVVAADGMHSDIRRKFFSAQVKSGPYRIVYQWLKPGSGLKEESIIGFIKEVVYLIQTSGNRALLAYYTQNDHDTEEAFLHELKQMISREYGGELELDEESRQIFAAEEVHADMHYDGPVALVGDALHGHPPTLAMGTSMALEDSAELAKQLDEHDDLQDALKAFAKVRLDRMDHVYRAQGIVENMFITDSDMKVALSQGVVRYGGSIMLEHYIKNIVS